MVTQNIKIIMDDRKLPDIRMVSGDVGRDIFPAVYASEDAEEALDLTAYEFRVIFIKPDNTFVIEDYLDGMIEIPEQAGAVTGRGFYQIRISKTGEEIYSGQGDFYIDDQILNDSMVESIAEVNGRNFPDDFPTKAELENYVTKDEIADMATQSYVDEAISHLDVKHIYSNEEQIVGTWLDDKPIYEKTINISSSQWPNDENTIAHNIANVDIITNIKGVIKKSGNGNTTPLITNHPNSSWSSGVFNLTRTNFVLFIGNSLRQYCISAEITIQYTKTTD